MFSYIELFLSSFVKVAGKSIHWFAFSLTEATQESTPPSREIPQGCQWTWKTWNSLEFESGAWKTWNNLKLHRFFRVEPGKIVFAKFLKFFNLYLLSMKNVNSNW